MNIKSKTFLVDDDPFCVTLYQQHLQNIGYSNLFTFFSGKELLENLDQQPDIIFLDYNLDDYTGEELLNKIKEFNPAINVVIISSQPKMEIAINLLNNGAFDYIIKQDKLPEKLSEVTYKLLVSLGQKENLKEEFSLHSPKELAKIIVDAQNKVRKEISSELHDNINQLLGASKMYIEMARNDDRNRIYLMDESKRILEMGISEIRDLSHNLYSIFIKNIDLEEALFRLIDTLEKLNTFSITHNIRLDNLKAHLSPESQHSIFRIFQELINNIVMYSKATSVNIEVVMDNANLVLNVSDDGLGFDLENTRKGLGFISIMNRISNLYGTYKVIASPGKGCQWNATIPLSEILDVSM